MKTESNDLKLQELRFYKNKKIVGFNKLNQNFTSLELTNLKEEHEKEKGLEGDNKLRMVEEFKVRMKPIDFVKFLGNEVLIISE